MRRNPHFLRRVPYWPTLVRRNIKNKKIKILKTEYCGGSQTTETDSHGRIRKCGTMNHRQYVLIERRLGEP